MPLTSFTRDSEVRFSVNIKDINGVDADPTTLIFKFQRPDGVEDTAKVFGIDAEIVKDDTGDYHIDVLLDKSGHYTYRWKGTGAVVGSAERKIFVIKSDF